ncbi:MAG: T9SS type A sorting domain-containing protein, partial [Flavisolibacter sp.]
NPSVRSISQPKGQSLDALADIVMNQPICRASSSSAATLAMAFTVNISSKQAGVRCELLTYNSGTWSFGADGTYTGSDGQNRWLPSVNIDANGKIGLGFNISGSRTYPSIGNIVLTPNGQTFNTSAEYRIASGTASSVCSGRYGDYNHMVIDPSDGLTFWFTAMYNPAPSWSTKIGSFSASSPNPAIVQKTSIQNQIIPGLPTHLMAYPNPVNNTLVLELPGTLTNGIVEIINMNGEIISRQNVLTRQTSLNTSRLNNGAYILKVRSGKGVEYLKFFKQ